MDGLAQIEPEEAIVILEHREMGGASASPFARRRLFTPPHHRLEGLALPIELLPSRLDLLHAPDMVLPWAWRGPTVLTVHDLAFLRRPELLTAESARYYAGVRRSLRVAGRIIAVSEHSRREILDLCPVDPERLRVIPNAVHPRYRQAGDPEADRRIALRYGLDGAFLLFVSTIEPRKNILTLLEAYRRVLDEGREIPLALVGAEGWRSAPVHAAVRRLGLEDRAHFLGFVPDEDLAALYRLASLLAHPAVDEGFGLTPAEAMAAGTPVLVSHAGSLPDVVAEAGILLPAEDASAWAAAIGRLLDDPALAADLAARGPLQVASLTRRSMARATLAVYREALAEAAAGGMA